MVCGDGKGLVFYRRYDSDYKSTESGWMDEVFSALGKATNTLDVNAWYKLFNNATLSWTYVCNELAAGKAVTVGTPSGSPNLVGSHAYEVDYVYTAGVNHVVLRNPWGWAGNPAAYVDLTAQQLFDSISRVQSAFGAMLAKFSRFLKPGVK